ncbi:GH25 family lysozyme [Anaerolentibacter hominis]|uniref:GH25 family lysozyme n=1 Tax=Anaerolentibacter hominis TaxID=3079009 RepID=UPI0031B837F8
MDRGIDVSSWQGKINFARVARAGIKVVYIRSSLGSDYTDPQFRRNYKEAKKHGLKVGFYHFVTARSKEQARAQARFFVSVLRETDPDCALAMDFESFGTLNRREINEIAEEFIKTAGNLSKKSMAVYSDQYNAAHTFDETLTKYPLWIAQYGVRRPSSDIRWKDWAGWQYSDKGRIDGIGGENVDLDWFKDQIYLREEEKGKLPSKKKHVVYYVVKSGDTLSRIAAKYHTTVAKIAKENHLSNPNLIYPGTILKIPVKKVRRRYYRVKSGDTIWGIARKLGVSEARLTGINKIKNPDLIYPGQRLEY